MTTSINTQQADGKFQKKRGVAAEVTRRTYFALSFRLVNPAIGPEVRLL